MKIKNNFELNINPWKWLLIVAAFLIIILIIKGETATAINALTQWLPKPK